MNELQKKFGDQRRWVNYKFVPVEGENKVTKVPYQINGKKADSTDPKTWNTYKSVKSNSDLIGLEFGLKGTLLGIDIDHCIENGVIVHPLHHQIQQLILEADSYTELSPSKTGIHILINLKEPLLVPDGNHKKEPFEVYTSKRFFTVTEEPFGEERPIRTIGIEEAQAILSIINWPWKQQSDQKVTKSDQEVTEDPDEEVLKRMFISKNGLEIEDLYNGNIVKYNGDDSSADAALCLHLAFWTVKNAEQMERIWLASPLGQRKKTQQRRDYRIRTISNAIYVCKSVHEKEINFLTVKRNKEEIVILCFENICRVLLQHQLFKNRFRFDIFKNSYEFFDTKIWKPLEDNHVLEIQAHIQTQLPFFKTVGKDMVFDAITKVSKDNSYDSAIQYLESLIWDKTPRLDDWLSITYGTNNDEYHKKVGSNWLKGLVQRLVQPGCQFDHVLVLEGRQGTKKSTSLHILGGDWHTETTMSTESKDFFMQFASKAIIEFSEGETLSKTDVLRLKAIITMRVDRYRLPYERMTKDYPRRCVFAMTTNQDEYLKDETGNRRWLPVKVMLPQVNIEWLKKNREQIFAEAYHRVIILKETTYEFPQDILEQEQSQRLIHDENEDPIVEWYEKLSMREKENGITIRQVYSLVIIVTTFSSKPLDKWQEMKIANVLKNVLKLEKRKVRIDGVQQKRWFQQGIEINNENLSVIQGIIDEDF